MITTGRKLPVMSYIRENKPFQRAQQYLRFTFAIRATFSRTASRYIISLKLPSGSIKNCISTKNANAWIGNSADVAGRNFYTVRKFNEKY